MNISKETFNCVKRYQEEAPSTVLRKLKIKLMGGWMWSRKPGKASPSLKIETFSRALKEEKRKTCQAK